MKYDVNFKERTLVGFCVCFAKVAKDCRSVFLDGNETRGSENVTIMVRVGGHVTQLRLRVWVPDN